jgi:hypothetical protein
MDLIHIGETVEVRRADRPIWRGEVTDIAPDGTTAMVRCIVAPDRPPVIGVNTEWRP